MEHEKISLCCITGNCEGIIRRFVEAFRPLVDEICIVRAIGNQKHDRTLSLALELGCRVGEYKNCKAEWPHVDDFAAARNVAWEMASHEWVMWADIDDLISKESIEELRRLVDAAPADVNMIQCPYDVPDQHIYENHRERIVRKGQFKWIEPVHEFLATLPDIKPLALQTKKASIVHADKSDRTPSCERNLRIMENIPESERVAGVYFYMFSEYKGLGRNTEAISAAQKFMEFKNAGENEKFEVYLQMAQLADDPSQISALLLEAHRISPDRREALYELANLELTFGNVDRAIAYVRQMQALPKPERQMWNVRGRLYSWAGDQLEDQVLRCDGLGYHADAREFNRWKEAGGKISLLHATRGRTLQASKTRTTWLERAKNPQGIEHVFAIDADDEHSQPLRRFKNVMVSGQGGCVEAWNVAAHASRGEVLVQLSDDWIPPYNWDEIILKRIGDTSKPVVLAVSDGNRKDGLLCMAILTRARWEQQGKTLFHPDFKGVFSDTWFSRSAYKDNVAIDARDVEFAHLHPLFGTAENDETYTRQNSQERYVEGERIYRQLERAEGRTINTTCCVRLGDNLSHLQLLRKLARRHPRTQFYHSAAEDYLPQLRELVVDLPNVELGSQVREGAIEVWKGHGGFWYSHPQKNDFCQFYVQWFDEVAKKMGLENPIKAPEHFLFDYPGLIRKTPLDGNFDFLIINSPPMSGQLRNYSDLSNTVLKLKNEFGYSVITTHPVLGAECTQDWKLTVTDIGALSRFCRFIIMVSTGPSWPTFNIYNQATVELRIIMLDNEKINIAPNTVHVSNEDQIWEVLKAKKLLHDI
jgi:tetratricopeptide (TPR) repeat protein